MRDAVGHDRDQLHEPARGVVEPSSASEHGVRDRGRQVGGRPGGEQLGDVERVAAGRRVHLVRVVAGERGDRALRQRRELENDRVVGADRADGRVQRMARRRLAASEGQHEQRRQRADPPPEHGDRVERRVVRPVHVLEHEHRRPRRELELRDQQRLDVVRRGAGRERLLERRRDAPDEVADRAQRPRDREVVAGAEQHPSPRRPRSRSEPGDERGLADPRLAGDEDDPTIAPRRRLARLGERGQCAVALEQLHRSKIDPARSWASPPGAAVAYAGLPNSDRESHRWTRAVGSQVSVFARPLKGDPWHRQPTPLSSTCWRT